MMTKIRTRTKNGIPFIVNRCDKCETETTHEFCPDGYFLNSLFFDKIHFKCPKCEAKYELYFDLPVKISPVN